MRHWMILMLTTIIGVIGFSTIDAAQTTVQPSASVLSRSRHYYLAHEDALLNLYDIDQGFQTAFDSHNKVWVYDQTRQPPLAKSIRVAENNWNHALGKKVFVKGSKRHHTLVVKLTTNHQNQQSAEVAWWQPLSQTVLIDQNAYLGEKQTISKYMKANVARSGADDTTAVDSLIDASVANTARQVEYARIITHEFGHVLGLLHSKKATDLMYAGLSFTDIYQYAKVVQPQIWQNPLSKMDINRGKLALKLIT
ncbi:matrixin family metalloprotease [Secundilactobacillus folii]|uniref:Matrixin family metalloprotease n=1 Tax=Secundilactobacillus folii TaxID=2678357 RepID=A0A7X3C2K4_9LACO|nr:matrixin family metalloprotease [Secundilactobacillus folii]MTV81646.1 matrixin family metalloprotease [Secundilactobacillus folii]